jgi:hypothetical protein
MVRSTVGSKIAGALECTLLNFYNDEVLSFEGPRLRGEAVKIKHWRIGTAARILGEPVERTRRRVSEKELPLVVRGEEQLIPRHSVLGLRGRLERENSVDCSPVEKPQRNKKPSTPRQKRPRSPDKACRLLRTSAFDSCAATIRGVLAHLRFQHLDGAAALRGAPGRRSEANDFVRWGRRGGPPP